MDVSRKVRLLGQFRRISPEADGFEVLVTGDQTLSYEQNLPERRLAVVALSLIEWRLLKHHLPKIIAAVNGAAPGSFQAVDCGIFSRKN
ncbi:MAG: hypothetical protein M3Y57_22430 [Acidobacteriota bacterium]|nr:hypothetical protein [Acidobacteriota bacterium]